MRGISPQPSPRRDTARITPSSAGPWARVTVERVRCSKRKTPLCAASRARTRYAVDATHEAPRSCFRLTDLVSHTWQWPRVCSVRFTRLLTVLGAVLGLALALWLVAHVGLVSILSAIGKIHWCQFALICLAYPLVLIADSIGWHFSFPRGSAPFTQLLLARAAGEAVNAASAIAPVGGEPVRAWLVRPWVPYEESVP